MLNFAVGKRDQRTTDVFVEGLRLATSSQRFQITTDGFSPYKSAIATTLDDRVDFAQLIKVYRATAEGERRYSPAEVESAETVIGIGQPDPKRICTSHIERQNLSMRMGIRRFTRLTNAFSKKWENHWAAVAVWFAFYNFCRIHRSLRITPAMAAGITDHVWDLKELVSSLYLHYPSSSSGESPSGSRRRRTESRPVSIPVARLQTGGTDLYSPREAIL